MAAAVAWYGSDGSNLQSLASSGIGFFGDDGFGDSILVGSWNGHCYKTNSAGTVQSTELWNNKYVNGTGVILGQSGSGLQLDQIPNQQALINIRFTYDTPVRVQNATIRAYDRVTSTSMPSGITVAMYNVVHTGTSQTPDGSGGPSQPTTSGEHRWWVWDGVTATGAMPLHNSPGTSGLSPSGSNTEDIRHDFFVAASCSPNSIGSKLFGAFFSCEFL